MPRTIKPFPIEVSKEEREFILNYLNERFGFAQETFDNYHILKGVKNYWLLSKSQHLEKLRSLSVEVVGLVFLRQVSEYLKPTSAFLQRFGYLAKKNVVYLREEDVNFLSEHPFLRIDLPLEPGYVILRDSNWVLGCGLYLPGRLYAFFEKKFLKILTGS